MSGTLSMAQHGSSGLAAERVHPATKGSRALRHASSPSAPHAAAPSRSRQQRTSGVVPLAAQSVRMADMSAQMADMRAQMEENEQLSVLMAGLRGSNMNAEDFADQDVVMQLISVSDSDGEVHLPSQACS